VTKIAKTKKDDGDFSALVKRLNTAKPAKEDIETWNKILAETPGRSTAVSTKVSNF